MKNGVRPKDDTWAVVRRGCHGCIDCGYCYNKLRD